MFKLIARVTSSIERNTCIVRMLIFEVISLCAHFYSFLFIAQFFFQNLHFDAEIFFFVVRVSPVSARDRDKLNRRSREILRILLPDRSR